MKVVFDMLEAFSLALVRPSLVRRQRLRYGVLGFTSDARKPENKSWKMKGVLSGTIGTMKL